MTFVSASLAAGILLTVTTAHAADQKSAALLHEALQAQGGEQALRSLKSVQWTASGYRNELEESERPEGPYIVEMNEISEVHDLEAHRYRYQQISSLYPVARFTTVVVVADNVSMRILSSSSPAGPPQQAAQPGTIQQVHAAHERMALSPERLLLTALDAADLHSLPDLTLQSIPQNVVSFTLDGAPVIVYLNPYTHLPTAVDYSGPLAHSGFWNYLGDVTMRTYFSFWWLACQGRSKTRPLRRSKSRPVVGREVVEYLGEKGRWSVAEAALLPRGAFGGGSVSVRRLASVCGGSA